MRNNPIIKFLPLLLLYIIILVFVRDAFLKDQDRYLMFASNLAQGFYSPRGSINLWNGPGYPIVLVPFIGLHLPLIWAKLLNVIFLFLAVIYFYRTLSIYIRPPYPIYFAYLFGLYIPFFRYIRWLVTEVFAIFLICGFIYHFCQWVRGVNRRGNFLAAILFLGYLALTKVFFGYVILVGLIISLLLGLCGLRRIFKFSLPVYLGAFVVCIPYLIYTYSLTGKGFYWGNAGGEALYWMSTLNPNEFGDHNDPRWALRQPEFAGHKEFFTYALKLNSVKRDDEFKKKALANILSNPKKYIINCIANVGRMIFGFPYSYRFQKLSIYFYMIPNIFLIVPFILCIFVFFTRGLSAPPEFYNILLFGAITFFGSSLLSAFPRQLFPVIPAILLIVGFTLTNILKIEVRN